MIRTTAPTITAAAMKTRLVSSSPASAHPRNTATIGLTYAYVETRDAVVARRSQMYAPKPTSEPNTKRYAVATTDFVETALGSNRASSPDANPTIASRVPPVRSVAAVAITGEDGRREPREKSEPPAHAKVPATRTRIAPTLYRPAPRKSPGPTRTASPAVPRARPERTSPLGIRRWRTASINTTAMGSVATTSAATPDGRYLSAQTKPPEPPTKRSPPVIAAPGTRAGSGRRCPSTAPTHKAPRPQARSGFPA